jgi:predicted PurR-regulated permease PerM
MTMTERWPRLLQGGPLRFGFVVTIGVLIGLALGFAVTVLGYPLTLIFLALFISLGLYPVVLRLERLKLSRTVAVLIVLVAFVLIIAVLLLLIIPVVVTEAGKLVAYLPNGISDIEHQDWFISLDETFGGAILPFVEQVRAAAADPNVWLAVSGGALRVGAGILNGTLGVLFVVALTLYFVSSMELMKRGLYSLVPASKEARFVEIAEEIFTSVGKYLSRMFLLALMNGVFTFILLTIVGNPYAILLGVLAVPIAFIPIIGSVINTAIVTIVTFFFSPLSGLIVLIVMFVYMQVEAYVFTPRIVGKAISVPGPLVLIGAMVGATLLGLLGALVACPVSASLLLITKKVIVPAQKAL